MHRRKSPAQGQFRYMRGEVDLAKILRMRNILGVEIKRGDWAALVLRVRETTRLKTGKLSEMAGVSPETWWRWENRGQKPKEAEVVRAFADAFHVEPELALWAAGLTITSTSPAADPRLAGLDPKDKTVRKILDGPFDYDMQEEMLENLRAQRAQERELQQRRELDEIERLEQVWRRRGKGA